MRRSSRALKEIVDIKFTGRAIIIILISLFLLMPAIATEIKHPKQSILETIHRIFFSLLFFLIPIAFFYRNINAYLYLLLIWIVLTPFFLFSIVLFDVTPGIDMITLVKQTDKGEVAEQAFKRSCKIIF
jgi:glucan phosphoethanolaminetransferase (alkaline phosphatase superfamily)